MRRFKKPLIGLVLLFAVYTLVGFFALPPLLKSVLVKKLSDNLKREVSIEKIKVNPYILSVAVQGFKVKDRGSSETFAACGEIFVNLQSLSALKRELILKEIRIQQPFLRLVRKADGSYNFSDLLKKKPSTTKDKGKPFLFSLNNIQVRDGSIDFFDEGPNKKHTARELNLSIPSISNTPQRVEIFVQPALFVKVNGTPYELRGKTKPFADSLESVVDLEFRDLDLPYYLSYIPLKMNFRVPSAYLDAQAKIIFLRSKNKAPSVTLMGNLAIKKLAVDDLEGKPIFRLPRLDVSIAPTKPLARTVHLAKVAIQSPELEIRRNPNGSFNLESLLPEKSKTAKEKGNKENSAPLAMTIDEISLSGGRVAFSDLSRKVPFSTTLSPVELKVAHFSNGKDKKTDFSVSLVTEAKETMKMEGSLSIEPLLQAEGALELKGFNLRKYSPYYGDRIRFDIAEGRVDLATRYQFARNEKALPLSLKELSLALRSLRLKPKGGKEDFLRIPLLTIQQTDLDLYRKELRVGRVFTEKGTLGVALLKDGSVDLMEFLRLPPGGKEEKTSPEQKWLFTLGQMTLDQYSVKMKDLVPPTPVTFVAEKIRVSGENISTGKGQKGKISLSLRGLKLQKMGEQEPFLSIPLFSVKGASLDLNKQEVVVREMSTRNGAIQIQRSKNGEINLLSLLPPPKGKDRNPEKKKSPKQEKPWAVKLQRIVIDQYQLRFEDSFPSDPATLSIQDLALKAENLTTVKGQRAKASLAFRLNEKGSVALDGSVGVNPLAADLKIALKGITISPLQSYFSDRVKLVVTDGSLSTTGTLSLLSQEKGKWQVSYKGDGSVDHFASIDKIKGEDFLKWESFSIAGMDVGYNPLYVRIDGIALSNFYTRLIIFPDGSLNVQNILGKTNQQQKAPSPSAPQKESPPKKPPSATPDAPVPEIKIARITLQGGEIKFSDNYIKPNYSANLSEVGGKVSDINAAEMRSGALELRGMWDKVDPVEIVGNVNPVAQDLFVDLNVRLKDIELSPMTPYAGKYIGYTIQKGKLAMDLKYLIVKKKLEAQNKIFFDQLTLGERVKSPQATKLPVKFAISLLKNRKGEIRLDVPVTGSLNDPKFSVFKIILQVLTNLLAKAATSPFALLGAMVGGGEQLEYAEFDYGSSEIKGETLNKMKTMVKVLQDRPGIRLEVEGHADMEKDREALKTLFFQRKIKTQKLKEIARKGQPAAPVDEIKIETSEYARYLKKAYREGKFPKPKNFLGFEKNIPVPEMEKLLFTHTEVKEGDLRDLVLQRCRKVKDFLVREGKIEPERVFLVEAKSLAPEKKGKLKDSRVVFRMK